MLWSPIICFERKVCVLENSLDIINYRFLTTETNLKALYIFRCFFYNLISKAICSDCTDFCLQIFVYNCVFRKKENTIYETFHILKMKTHFKKDYYYSLVLSLIAMENGFQLNLYPPNFPGGQSKWWTIGYYIWAEATWKLPPATECSFTMKKLDGIFLIWKFRFLGPGMSLLWSVPLTSIKVIQVHIYLP